MSRTTDAILSGRSWGTAPAARLVPQRNPFAGTGWYVLKITGWRGDTTLAQIVTGPLLRHEQAMRFIPAGGESNMVISNDFKADSIEVQA